MLSVKKNVKDLTKIKYFEVLPNFKDEQTQKLTSVILTLVAISLFGFFAINPTLSTIAKLRKELVDNRLVEKRLEVKIQNLSLLQQKYTEIQPYISIALDAIPDNAESPLLMAQLQSIAQETNIKIVNLQNLAVELFKANSRDQKGDYSYSFSLSGGGSFEDIVRFMGSIVNMQRVVNIDTFSIDKTADKDGLLRFSLQGKAYYKP